MINPVVGDNKRKALCRYIVKFCQNWFVKNFVYPALIVAPTMLLVTSVQKGDPVKWFGEVAGGILNAISPVVIVVVCTLYLVLIRTIYAFVKGYAKPGKELEKNDLLAIISALDVVVAEKSKRMNRKATEIGKLQNVCAKKTFHQITQPEQQISLLVTAIHSVFEFLSQGGVDYRVGLIKVENDKPIEWVTFHPLSRPPATEASALSAPTSTVARCIKARAMVVVADVKAELGKRKKDDRRYFSTNDAKIDGSQLCYPIIHPGTQKIQHVVTIAGNKPDSLNEKHDELYLWVLNHFVVRLSMEYSLLIMKEKAND
jgi:hypothetical protein